MTDPLTLAAVGSTVLTEGIKFLYAQASEAIKRWRARDSSNHSEPSEVELPAALGGKRLKLAVHAEVLAQVAEDLRQLRKDLSEIADGTSDASAGDAELVRKVDTFRKLLEAVYGARFDFTGENRGANAWPNVSGRVDVETLLGYAAGVRAEAIEAGVIAGHVVAGTIASGGAAVGVEAKVIR